MAEVQRGHRQQRKGPERQGPSPSAVEAAIQEVALLVASTLDVEEVYEDFALKVKELVDFDRLFINVLNLETGRYAVNYIWGSQPAADSLGLGMSRQDTQTYQVVTTGQPLIRDDLTHGPKYVDDADNLKAGLRSSISLPLTVKGRVIGTLGLRSRRVGAYGLADQVVLERLARLIAPAVENAALYQQLQEHTQEMALVDEVARIITSTLDIDQVYESFAQEARKLVDFDRMVINVVDEDCRNFTITYASGIEQPGRCLGDTIPLAGTQTQHVVTTGQTLVRTDLASDIRFAADRASLEAGIRSVIITPLNSTGKVIGALSASSRRNNIFGPRERAIQERLAMQIAPALENANLYRRFQHRNQEIHLVDQVARIITSTLDIDQVYDEFASELKNLVDFDRAYINLANRESDTYIIKYVAGQHQEGRLPGQVKPMKGSHTEHVIKLGQTLCRADVSRDCSFPSDREQLDWGAHSSIGVPLFSKGQPIGIMGLRSRRIGAYGPREQAIVERLAGQIAPAVENAELYQQRKETESAERLQTLQMEALYSIARMVAEPGRFEEKCNDILEVVVNAAQADAGAIRLAAEDGQSLHLAAYVNPGNLGTDPTPLVHPGQGAAGIALETGEPTVANDYRAFPAATQQGKNRGIRASVALPVKVGPQVLGIINAVSGKTGHFTPERVRILSAIADGLGTLLEKSRLTQDLQATTAEMEVVDETAQIITSTLDIDEVYERFAQELQKKVPFDRMNINTVDLSQGAYTVKYLSGIVQPWRRPGDVLSLENSQTLLVAETGRTMITHDLSQDPRFHADQELSDVGLRSRIMTPLISRGNAIGTLSLHSRIPGAFGTRERVFVERLARQIAPAIENAQLYEQARNEKELATTALAQLKALLAGVDTGILLVGNDQEILLANHRYGELFGIDDVDSWALAHPRREDRQELFRRTLADPDKVYVEGATILADPTYAGPTQEIELAHPARRILQPFTTPVYDEAGQSLGRLWVYHDITETRAAQQQLLQFQKIESIGRLAGGVAHDFNNLLTAIMGYSQLAIMDVPSNGLLAGHIQEIQRASERAANLTSQLLAFSRRQVVEPRVIDLHHLILDLDRLLRRLIGEDIELVTLPSTEAGAVKVDPSQIEQVLVNLVVNARDAMPTGGRLVIETAPTILNVSPPLQRSGAASGKYVMLSVSDTGVGMSEEVKTHLFEPFFTTKEVGEGTGLGLATCYGIIKQHGGHIQVDSEPGRGTTVRVYLPQSTESSVAYTQKEPAGPAVCGTETVLLAEDDPLVRSMVASILLDQGYTVIQASNGDEALRLAQEQVGRRIDLLLSDIVMPQMGGVELASRIKEMLPNVKIILTSGYSDEPIFRTGIGEWPIEFIQKPFIPAELTSRVREVLDRVE